MPRMRWCSCCLSCCSARSCAEIAGCAGADAGVWTAIGFAVDGVGAAGRGAGAVCGAGVGADTGAVSDAAPDVASVADALRLCAAGDEVWARPALGSATSTVDKMKRHTGWEQRTRQIQQALSFGVIIQTRIRQKSCRILPDTPASPPFHAHHCQCSAPFASPAIHALHWNRSGLRTKSAHSAPCR